MISAAASRTLLCLVSLGVGLVVVLPFRAVAPQNTTVQLIASLAGFTASLLIGLGWISFARPLTPWIAAARKRPLRTLAAVAVTAVVLQCHPVVFFGRSFVSPNNGSPMLYEGFPTLPGSTHTHTEDVKGSDVAALFHQSLYYPSIQREALFEHREFPLWNRYFMCGLPLLGQGQSMFGSFFNWIPLLGDASATSWDARYVLSRIVYAFAMGTSVWLLTSSLGSGIMTCVLATFIGFFGFRLNHMAQFSLEAAALLLLAWVVIGHVRTYRGLAWSLLLLVGAHWEVFCSGTVKEAYTFILFIDVLGAMLLLVSARPWRAKALVVTWSLLAGVVFVLVSAPLWSTFVSTLAVSHTDSDTARVYQAPSWQFVAFFDDLFYGQVNPSENRVLPSSNLACLLLVSAAIVSLRGCWRNRELWCFVGLFVLAAMLVFNVISPLTILRVPFLNRLQHLHNVVSGVMVLLSLVLAGYGVNHLRSLLAGSGNRLALHLGAVLLISAIPVWIYFSHVSPGTCSAFFHGYMGSAGVAAGVCAVCLLTCHRSGRAEFVGIAAFAVFASALWRHGQYVRTPFDAYVVNPQPRLDLRAPSEAVKHVQQRMGDEPARPAGIGFTLFAGYNQLLGWESVYGIDAVRDPQYDGLAARAGLNKLMWVLPDTLKQLGGEPNAWNEDNLSKLLPIHDLLNVRYYLAPLAWTPTPAGLVASRGNFDLSVYESPTAWPRAFFTDRIVGIDDVASLARMLNTPEGRRPFAAVEREDARQLGLKYVSAAAAAGRAVVPASKYRLTSNSTTVMVTAPSAGIVVLTENHVPGDFRVTVNRTEAPVVRVNHAFKGVFLPRAGDYEITFAYWPRHFPRALVGAAAGLLLAALLGFVLWRKKDGGELAEMPA